MENNNSPQLNELFAALAKAQCIMASAIKDSQNPYFKSSYADLTSVWDAIRKPLTDNGLCIIQSCQSENGVSYLETWLGHTSGQWMRSRIPLTPAKSDPQTMGSYITYMRRYTLSALVGVVADIDDDGNKATDASTKIKPLIAGKLKIEELKQLLKLDEKLKNDVENYLFQTLGLHSYDEMELGTFNKIMKQVKQKVEANNDTAKSGQ